MIVFQGIYFGTAGDSYLREKRDDEQEEEGFYSPESVPSLYVTRARFRVRINQIKSNQIRAFKTFVTHKSHALSNSTDEPCR